MHRRNMEYFLLLLFLTPSVFSFDDIKLGIETLCNSNSWTHLDFKEQSESKLREKALNKCAISLKNLPNGTLSKKIIDLLPASKIRALGISDGLLKIEDNALEDLNHLTYLRLSQNNLSTSDLLQGNASFYKTIDWLDLSGNNLKDVAFLGTKSRKLEKIDLSNNELTEFPSELMNFPSLREISIHTNRITKFPDDMKSFDQVQYLNIRQNNVSDWSGLPKFTFLKYLDASSNSIKSLEFVIRRHNQASGYDLRDLKMDFNQVEGLQVDIFFRMPFLKRFSMRWSYLKALYSYVGTGGTTSLEHIDLGHNSLSRIPTNFFLQLKDLMTINLESNKISRIEHGAFSELSKLQYLNLMDNQIEVFQPELILPTKSLTDLVLGQNRIGTFDYVSLYFQAPNLRNLSITRNRIPCDEVSGLLYFIQKAKIKLNRDYHCESNERSVGNICCNYTSGDLDLIQKIERKLNKLFNLFLQQNQSDAKILNGEERINPTHEKLVDTEGYITTFTFWAGIIIVTVALLIFVLMQTLYIRRNIKNYARVSK